VTLQSFDMSDAPEARGQFIGDSFGMTTNRTVFEPFFIESDARTTVVPTPPTDAFFSSVP
jgi:hypothetical protein